ncbi:MAG: 4Fe-4S binding protein [Nanoarchaeota archaeon]|nr:4Fe-4S binding protein [Nanoarchaeota archaeon]
MPKVTIDKERCKECSFCITVCPTKVLKMSSKLNKKGYHYAEVIAPEKCTGCGMCFQMCPDLCIEVEK